ncbi:anhydro-N-acetylmuramic acid kinase [Meridianimarinicoccus roseus]|uniref:anhydro-N-acetylmuramic acid kinase n=1 Tax=Meridianimarinicoccus roseus TaxID=2072018 RepID=UPI0026858D0D
MKGKALLDDSGPVWALGTMSGTSLDGVDAAAILTDGERVLDFGPGAYRAYSDNERGVLHGALGLWPGAPGVAAAAEVVQDAHRDLLADLPGALIGFHGQTLAHDPGGRGTHQAGDGAALAAALGRPVVWDFRSADVAAGGQGAPLAPAFHFALAGHVGARGPVVFLNLGGVGNLTWLDPACDGPFAPGAMLAFDTGPANAPLNDMMRARFGQAMDRDGALAASGMPSREVLHTFLGLPFFAAPPPKSLDRDAFAQLVAAVTGLPDADAAATLAEAAVQGVVRGLAWCPRPAGRVLVTGGGRRNRHIMARLSAELVCPVIPVEDVGLDGDLLEAQAFAFLAVRAARGLPLSGPCTTGVATPLTGGRVSCPT